MKLKDIFKVEVTPLVKMFKKDENDKMDMQNKKSESSEPMKTAVPKKKPESIHSDPYAIYIILTTVLFLFLVVMGYLAWKNDWLPHHEDSGSSVRQVGTQ